MDQRSQCLTYFAKKLGYITSEEYQVAIAAEITFEDFIAKKSPQLSLMQKKYLDFIFVKHCFLKNAQQFGYLDDSQSKEFLQKKIDSIKRGAVSVELLSITEKYISLEQAYQIIEKLIGQKVLTPDETDILKKIYDNIKETPQSSPNAKKIYSPSITEKFTTKDIEKLRNNSDQDIYAPPVTQKISLEHAKFLNMRQIGPYRILEEIGTGGMGKVYKAYHPQMDRTVAIKVMLRSSETSEQERNRFIAEAKLTAKLQHRNIVKVYDVNAMDGMDYIVMDYVDGISLSSILKTNKPSLKKCLEIIYEVAMAMDYAHSKGVIHRDLKPSNLMIDNNANHPIIMDFGLAKNTELTSEVTKSGAILGTPRYMAPEQASGKNRDVTAATDVYALGAILYFMVTGVHAVKGDTPGKIIYNVLHEEIIPPKKFNNRLPVQIETICLKALQKDPKMRYANAQLFAEDIERYLKGEVFSPALTAWHYSAQKLKKHRSNIFSVVVLGAFIVILILFVVKITYLTKDLKIVQKEKSSLESINEVEKMISRANEKWESGLWQNAALLYANALENEEKLPKKYSSYLRDKLSYLMPLVVSCKQVIPLDGTPTDMAFSSTEDIVVIVGLKGFTYLWTSLGSVPLEKVDDNLYCVEFSKDGVIVASGDNGIYFWNAKKGSLIETIKHDQPISDLTFNGTGSFFAVIDRAGIITIWNYNTKTKETVLPAKIPTGNKVAFHDQKDILFAGNTYGDFYSFDLSLLKEKRASFLPIILHNQQIIDILTGDNGRIITGSIDGTVQLLTLQFSSEYTIKDLPMSISSIANKSNLLAVGSYDNNIYLWDIYTKRIYNIIQGHEDLPLKVKFNSTGEILASIGLDKTLRIWNIPINKRKVLQKHFYSVTDLVFLEKKKWFASSSLDGYVHFWDIEGNPQKFLKTNMKMYSLGVNPSNKKIIVGSINRIEEWSISSQRMTQQFVTDNGTIFSLAYVNEEEFLMTDTMSVYIKGKNERRGYLGKAWAYQGRYNPQNNKIVFSHGKNVSLWDLKENKEPNLITISKSSTISSVALETNEKYLAYGTLNGTIFIWDLEADQLCKTMVGHDGYIQSMVFNGDDELVVVDSFGYLKIWNLSEGHIKISLKNHSQDAPCVLVHNQYTIISGSRDGGIVIRNLKPQNEMMDWDVKKIMEYIKNHTKLSLGENLEVLPLDGSWK